MMAVGNFIGYSHAGLAGASRTHAGVNVDDLRAQHSLHWSAVYDCQGRATCPPRRSTKGGLLFCSHDCHPLGEGHATLALPPGPRAMFGVDREHCMDLLWSAVVRQLCV